MPMASSAVVIVTAVTMSTALSANVATCRAW